MTTKQEFKDMLKLLIESGELKFKLGVEKRYIFGLSGPISTTPTLSILIDDQVVTKVK